MRRISLVVVILATLWSSCGGGDTGPTGTNPPPPPPPPPPSSPPTISSIAPTLGATAGGTRVTVTGSNINTAATLIVGGAAATGVTANGTSLTATTAPREPPGRVDVTVRNPDGQTVTLPGAFTYFFVRANTGGPYTADGNRNITMNGTTSIGNPFPIAHFFWNCGQNPHGKACDQDTPTPTFEYKQEGAKGSPDRTYTVTLRVVDTVGNSDTQTTTVRVRQTY